VTASDDRLGPRIRGHFVQAMRNPRSSCSLPDGAFADVRYGFTSCKRSLPGDVGVNRDRRAPEVAVNTFEQAFNREMELATYMKRVEAPVYWQG
jgi:hypothetical protein